MSSNVGLSTPRGSGTSGYVQRNLSHLRPRDQNSSQYHPKDYDKFQKHNQRQPDREILDHDRKRNVEVKCLELRDKLEDEGREENEIEEQVAALRKSMMGQLDSQRVDARGLKSHQVHELAQAKMAENARLQRALKISSDYEEGSHWKRQADDKIRRQQEFVMKEQLAFLERQKANEKELERERERDAEIRRKNRRDVSDSRSRSRSPSRSPGRIERRKSVSDTRSRSRSRGRRGSYNSRSRSRSRSTSRSRSASPDRRRRKDSRSPSRSRSRSRSYSRERERRRYSDSD